MSEVIKFINVKYLLALSGSYINTTPLSTESNYEVIEMNWCSYNIELKAVHAESSHNVKIKNQEFFEDSKVNLNILHRLENGENLEEIIQKLYDFIDDNFSKKNIQFGLIINQDFLNILIKDCKNKAINIDFLVSKHINIEEEFRSFYKMEKHQINEKLDLKDMLSILSLKQQLEVHKPSLVELNTLARIVNRMIRDGNIFKLKIIEKIIPENKHSYRKNLDNEIKKNPENNKTGTNSQTTNIQIMNNQINKNVHDDNLNKVNFGSDNLKVELSDFEFDKELSNDKKMLIDSVIDEKKINNKTGKNSQKEKKNERKLRNLHGENSEEKQSKLLIKEVKKNINNNAEIIKNYNFEKNDKEDVKMIDSELAEQKSSEIKKKIDEIKYNIINKDLKKYESNGEKQSDNVTKIVSDSIMKSKLGDIVNIDKTFYIRIKNLPLYFENRDLIQIFNKYNIKNEDISISHDIFKRKTGDACMKIHDTKDFYEIKSNANFRIYNNHIIVINQISENEFVSCLKNNPHSVTNIYKNEISTNRKIFLKIKNIPFSLKEDAILNFFKNYSLAENSIKLLRNKKGSFQGEAILALSDEKECEKAYFEKNGSLLINQYIVLEFSNIDEYEEFASSGAFNFTTKNLSEYVNPEIVCSSLFVWNLPLDISYECVYRIFEIFNLDESNFIFGYDSKILHNYGGVIVKFLSEDDAETARNYLNNKNIQFKERKRRIYAENLLTLVNKGNEF